MAAKKKSTAPAKQAKKAVKRLSMNKSELIMKVGRGGTAVAKSPKRVGVAKFKAGKSL